MGAVLSCFAGYIIFGSLLFSLFTTGPRNTAFALQTPGGWVTETITYQGHTVGQWSSLALDASGHPHISHYDATNGDLLYSYYDGSSWHTECVDDGTSEGGAKNVGKFTSIALDSNGYPHISYRAVTGANLKYAYKDTNDWHVETESADSANDVGKWTSIALRTVDSQVYPCISYYDVTNTALKYAWKDSSGWTAQTVHKVGTDVIGKYTSLKLDASGMPHISYYYDSPNNDLYYVKMVNNVWQSPTFVDGTSSDRGQYSSLALNSSGNPLIVHRAGASPYNLRFSEWNGSSWTNTALGVGVFQGSDMSLALDNNGLPGVSYYDNSNYLCYAYRDAGGTWHSANPNNILGTATYGTSLKFDSSGNPCISYYDSTNSCLGYAHWDPNPPTVSSTDPANGATGVALDKTITVTFSEDIQQGTNWSSINLKDQGGNNVAFSKSINGSVLTIDPTSNFNYSTTYTVYVPAGSVKDAAENGLASDYNFSFTTIADTTAPTVITTDPVNGASFVPVTKTITVTFSENVQAGANYSQIVLKDQSGTEVPVSKSINAAVLTIDPTGNLSGPAVTYTVYVPAASIKDLYNNDLASDYIFSFTTSYNSPHGPYDNFPVGCAGCHVAHSALGPKLMIRNNITTLCLTCHDGTASAFNVVYVAPENRDVYGFGFGTTSDAVYFHPVKDTGNPAIGTILECTNCHNPHGDPKAGGGVYARLLNSYDGTSRYYQGPDFCLACHGAVDRGFPSVEDQTVSYWVYTLGNHRNSQAAHYNTAKTALQPASGTLVTCAACHYKHASDQKRLLAKAEENLCFKCHNNTANSMSGRNIQDEFQSVSTASYHDIYGRTGAKLECSSCHGPHTVGAKSLSVSGTTYSQVANPDNTKSVMARTYAVQDNGVGNTVGTFTDFCLKCHDGSPPTATSGVYSYVPYTVVFPTGWRSNITTNVYGWNKSSYTGKSHDSASTPLLCTDCHKSHGSAYPVLQAYAEDSNTTYGECCRCHRTGGDVVATDVYTDLVRTYRHPTLYTSGKHSDTETYDNMPVANRHAECTDCHDPHRCDNTTAVAPAVYGSLKGVSGVSINFGTAGFSSWPGDAVFTAKSGVDYQYELCFKCHSYYSYRTSPPYFETDQAEEFSPNNPAYHAVVGESKMTQTFTYNGQTYHYGKFTGTDRNGNPWAYDSRMYCTDCHGSDSSSVPGPHGSASSYILKGPWFAYDKYDGTGGTSNNASNHLCYRCHDQAFYDGLTGGDGTATVRSKFSGGASYNLHKQSGGHEQLACAACHSAVPHAGSRRGFLVTTSDAAPYRAASQIISFRSFPDPGNWTCSDCDTTSIH